MKCGEADLPHISPRSNWYRAISNQYQLNMHITMVSWGILNQMNTAL